MLKGINRRIIEINKTNNDYFEKAILFVKSDKAGCSQQILKGQADLFLNELPKKEKKSVSIGKIVFGFAMILMVACIVVGTIYTIVYR